MNKAFAKELLEVLVEGYENGVEVLIPRVSEKRRNKFTHDVMGAAFTICFEKYMLEPQELNETMQWLSNRVSEHVFNETDIGIDLKNYGLLINKDLSLMNIALMQQNAIVKHKEFIEETMELVAKKMMSLMKEDDLESAKALAEKIRELCHNI
jgi:hypothetical protein